MSVAGHHRDSVRKRLDTPASPHCPTASPHTKSEGSEPKTARGPRPLTRPLIPLS